MQVVKPAVLVVLAVAATAAASLRRRRSQVEVDALWREATAHSTD